MSKNRSTSLQKVGAAALHRGPPTSIRSTSPAVTNTPMGRTPCTPSTAGNGPSVVGKKPGHVGPAVQMASANTAGGQRIKERKNKRKRGGGDIIFAYLL